MEKYMVDLLKNIKVDASYKDFLNIKSNTENLKNIERFLDKEVYFPYEKNVLRFLTVPLTNLKCVILGMDPYPSTYIDKGIETLMRDMEQWKTS